jgi:uncharacterized protein YkwD
MSRTAKPKSKPKSTPAPPTDNLSAALLAAHNAARAKAGRPPLRLDARLQDAALAQARDMAARGKLTHTGSDGSQFWQRITRAGYRYAQAAENIAMGYPDVKAVVAAWMADGPHRVNLLGPYRDIGAAGVQDKNGRWWWCADYGTAQ